ncbi:hypothetical protein [Amycolatopsis sp. WAC 01416]|uniref:hypothetical protein n=1 Tax=Amycolatopsis sp. WAC 01416 TaxID=2203196 RepID=UPI0013156ED1|nr:hypothetical protein [Amycolatopsis sp. WAC 01416]
MSAATHRRDPATNSGFRDMIDEPFAGVGASLYAEQERTGAEPSLRRARFCVRSSSATYSAATSLEMRST